MDRHASIDDPQMIGALEEYVAALERGAPPDRNEFLARHAPNIARLLAECLDGMDLVHAASHDLRDASDVDAGGARRPAAAEQALGDFRLIREVGRGGMGVVYEAEQVSLRRPVAVKVFPYAGVLEPKALQRFRNEAQAAALLDHPHIVPVYFVGQDRGTHFYAMRLINGGSLAELIRQRRRDQATLPDGARAAVGTGSQIVEQNGAADDEWRAADAGPAIPCASSAGETESKVRATTSADDSARLGTKPLIELGIQAAEALDYAHSQGVIHRDVKPSNLLLDEAGGLWVADFGIARMTQNRGPTATGDRLGTLRYMSPEQAGLTQRVVDHRTDIYSLGATIVEVCTGRPMIAGDDGVSVLRNLAEFRRRTPRTLDPRVPRDLETILLKATEYDPDDRYATAGELAEDLRRFVAGQPVLASRPSLGDRIFKWAARHRSVVVVSLLLIVLLTGLSTSLAWYASQVGTLNQDLQSSNVNLGRVNDELEQTLERAVAGERRATELLYAADMQLASHAWERGDYPTLRALLARQEPSQGEADLRGFEWSYLQNQFTRAPQIEIREDRAVYTVQQTEDRLISAGAAGRINFWDRQSGELVQSFDSGQGEVNTVCVFADAALLASAGDDGTVCIWDLDSGELQRTIEAHKGLAFGVAYDEPRDQLLTCGDDEVIRLWDAATGESRGALEGHTRAVEALSLAPDGRLMASASSDMTCRIWDLTTNTEVVVLEGHERRLSDVAFSPDAQRVATSSLDGVARVWKISGELCGRFRYERELQSIAYSGDGSSLAVGARDGSVRVWNLMNEAPVETLWTERKPNRIWWCGLSGDDRLLAVATWDGVHLKNLATEETRRLPLADESILEHGRSKQNTDPPRQQPFAWSPVGNLFLCVNELHRVEDLPGKPATLAAKLKVPPQSVCSAAFSPDGSQVAVGTTDGRLLLWTIDLGAAADAPQPADVTIDAHEGGQVGSVEFSVDGGKVLSGGDDNAVRLWLVKNGDLDRSFIGHGDHVTCVHFTPNDRYLASSSADQTLRIWDQTDGNIVHVYEWADGAGDFTYSLDGTTIYTTAVSDRRSIHAVDTRTLADQVVTPTDADVWNVSVSSEGRRLLFYGIDRNVRILTLPERAAGLRRNWQAHDGRVYDVSFDRDDATLLTASQDGGVRRWIAGSNDTRVFEGVHSVSLPHGASEAVMNRGVIGMWDLEDPSIGNRTFSSEHSSWGRVATSPAGDWIAAVNTIGIVAVWDRRTRRELARWRLNAPVGTDIGDLAFGRTRDELILLDGTSSEVLFMDSLNGTEFRRIACPEVGCIIRSQNESTLAIGLGRAAALVDLRSREFVARLGPHPDSVYTVAFSNDGRYIATAGNQGSVTLWDRATKQVVHRLHGHAGAVVALAFTPDDRSLIGLFGQQSLAVWSIERGDLVCELDAGIRPNHPGGFGQLAFTSDGRRLVIVHDGMATVHDVSLGPAGATN